MWTVFQCQAGHRDTEAAVILDPGAGFARPDDAGYQPDRAIGAWQDEGVVLCIDADRFYHPSANDDVQSGIAGGFGLFRQTEAQECGADREAPPDRLFVVPEIVLIALSRWSDS